MVLFRYFMLFLALSLIMFSPLAEAQSRAGSGPSSAKTSEAVDNSCRERVNDLRIGIGSLRNDINLIRQCSQNGQLAMRVGANIVCRDVTQGHHVWDVTKTDIRFATGPNTFGGNKNLIGPQGDPGRDVRCEPCAESWVNPVCPANHSGNYTAWQTCSSGVPTDCEACYGPAQEITQPCSCALPGTWQGPSCPPGFTGTHTALQTCSAFGQCCGSAPTASVECCNGGPCLPCDDWTPVNSWCNALNRNVVSSHSCPSGNCCDPEPATETCPDSCSPGFYTYNYTNWTICESGEQTRTCQRCDGAPADCGECGGECSRTCTPTCTTYSWIPSSGWGNCSGGGTTQECGTGTQTRPGECRCDQSGETVSNSLCALADRQRSCNGWTYSYGDWSSCSGGSKYRGCSRCDNTTAACSNCGGQCSSTDGCSSTGGCCQEPAACSSGQCFCAHPSGIWVNSVTGIHYECEHGGGCAPGASRTVNCRGGRGMNSFCYPNATETFTVQNEGAIGSAGTAVLCQGPYDYTSSCSGGADFVHYELNYQCTGSGWEFHGYWAQ